MKKINNQSGFGAIEVLLTLIVVILLVFVGWYIYHTDHKTNVSTPKSSTTSTTSPTPGWQTFNDSTISFKYPSTVTVAKIECPQTSETCVQAKDSSESGDGLIFYEQSSTLTAKDFAAQDDSGGGVGVISSNSNTINGFDTYTVETTSSGLGGTYTIWSSYLSHNNEVVSTSYHTNSTSVSLYNQIVGTLKLVN
jgi:hypothetical protein